MSNRERAKGLRGEHAVRSLLELYGWTVRGLEGEGDHLALRSGLVLHVECKNQARLQLPPWIRQAEAEAPDGTVPVVAYKYAARWRADLPLALFAESFGTPLTAETCRMYLDDLRHADPLRQDAP